MKKKIVIGSAIILMMVALLMLMLFVRKHHALSDEQLLGYGWKVYTSCESDGLVMEASDLNKIGKEWQLSYRWLDNGVFLHVKNDSQSNECIYIAK